MFRTDVYGLPPGIGGAAETYESAFRWGQFGVGIITGGLISASTIDAGNTPTWEVRPGLILGQITATGLWINYSPTATDGSEVAAGVLLTSFRMQDLQGTTQSRFFGILVGGPVQSSRLIGLDLMARQQMDKFQFDDTPGGLVGNHWFPYRRFSSKATAYTVLASDNYTLFDNTGALGSVTFTLPALANGYFLGFMVVADQTVVVASAAGDDMITVNDVAADSVAFSTGGDKIGGCVNIFSNPAGTKWIVQKPCSNAMTIAT